MSNEPVIRRMTMDDLPAVDAIEKATFARPWPESAYAHELQKNPAARYLVAETDGKVAGFAGAWIIIDESHITNIAVAEAARGQGIGRKLTEALLQYLSNLGAAYTTLEVRESNAAAIGLYRSLGFQAVGRRKRYYEDNGEDALIMVCDCLPPTDPDFEEPETLHLDEA
ncbi:MAG: ribosomal protein S18-alanine N-acetyltransferase [Clostridia bacterium]|nr:ribosomal protein S18-alanine N-acetyltransferase [Clostridia bacterium]